MRVKKIMAGLLASAMAVTGLAITASAEDIATASLTWADGVASWYWSASENAGISNSTVAITGNGSYTINAAVSSTTTDESTGEDVSGPCTGLEVFCLDVTFADGTVLSDVYPDVRIDVTGVKLGDNDIALDFSKIADSDLDTIEGSYNNYEGDAGNVIRQNLYNTWGGNIFAMDKPADLSYESITVDFTISGLPEDSAASDSSASDNTADADSSAAAGDTDASTGADKNTPDTGVEGVAVVAGLAVIAAGAVIVAKKRK